MGRPLAAPCSSPGPTWRPHAGRWLRDQVSRVRLGTPTAPSGSGRLPPLFRPQALASRSDAKTGTLCRTLCGRLCRAGPPGEQDLLFSSTGVLPAPLLEFLPFRPAFGFPNTMPSSSACSPPSSPAVVTLLPGKVELCIPRTDVESPGIQELLVGSWLSKAGGSAGTDLPLDGLPLISWRFS